ncbi:acyl-CoA carboxylase epsilon subunit [Umezawaea endophytica]
MVVGVVAGSGSAPASEAAVVRSEWGNPAHRVRRGLTPGPGAWRASGLPR